ncbi:MAG: ABC transporter ATP-binding protein [Proteobacteria bacterium]|nr:ABC transporter ATP-binding protein [Pseudomonadota bacterium]MBI3498128.1 ABC transporter ATP-binding protein [Pseudomonadota bacterium]
MHTVALSGVSKLWGESRAVDNVSFTAETGQLLVLLGPSGCGKSTTLRLIAGLESVSAGSVRIGGLDVTQLPPAKRRIAMVFQSYALFPHLSVAENILFGLRVRKVPRAEADRRLARVAELLGLSSLLLRRPSEISGGQQQRVALGRAIIAEAPVCLMDEPLSNLDAQLRGEMRREIRQLQQKLGMTMVYVTHDQTEAMSMADRVILMREGRIEQNAVPAELYTRPESIFVARFIGTPPMNIVALADGDGGAVIRGSAGPCLFAGQGEGLALGLRPEDIAIAGDIGLPARVAAIEYLGADSIVTAEVGEERLLIRAPGAMVLHPGQPISLDWPAAAMHVFERASGRRQDAALASPEPVYAAE